MRALARPRLSISIIGRVKLAVLPVPVWAMPIRSRRSSTIGMPWRLDRGGRGVAGIGHRLEDFGRKAQAVKAVWGRGRRSLVAIFAGSGFRAGDRYLGRSTLLKGAHPRAQAWRPELAARSDALQNRKKLPKVNKVPGLIVETPVRADHDDRMGQWPFAFRPCVPFARRFAPAWRAGWFSGAIGYRGGRGRGLAALFLWPISSGCPGPGRAANPIFRRPRR